MKRPRLFDLFLLLMALALALAMMLTLWIGDKGQSRHGYGTLDSLPPESFAKAFRGPLATQDNLWLPRNKYHQTYYKLQDIPFV